MPSRIPGAASPPAAPRSALRVRAAHPSRRRANVETVIVAGKIRKWNGSLLDVDVDRLGTRLAATRDFLYSATGVPQNPFPAK